MNDRPAATPPVKASWRTITVLTVIWAGLMISESIYISLLPLTLKRFTSDISLIGWILAIKPGLSIILQPLAGIITDKMWTPLGRRAVFLIIFAPAMGLCLYFLPGQAVFWHVVVLASLFQFFQDVLWGSDHPLLADLIPAHQRTFVMGLMTTSSQLVAFLFLWIGMGIWLGQGAPEVSRIGDWLGSVGLGWITQRHDETFVYQFCAVVSTLMVGGVAFFLREERVVPTPRPKLTLRRYLADFLGDPILRRFGLLGFVQYFFQNIIAGFVSLFAVNTLLVSKADFGEAWKWQALVAVPAFLFGAFVERWPKNWVMGGGYALSTVACVLGYFSQDAHDLLLVAIVWGVGQLLGLLTQKPFFTEYVPKDIIGQISGAYNTAFAISRMLALGLGGMMVKACGNDYRSIWIAGIVTGLLTVWVALSIPDRRFLARRAAAAGPQPFLMNTSPLPNVIVFLTDQQRHDTTGVHGCPLDLTPNFDRMARRGTHLVNSFTCQPVCGPARSCLQTGLYATQTGVWRNGIALDPRLPTLARYFNDAGYETGYIGKWHLADDKHKGPMPREEQGGYQSFLGANQLEMVTDAYDCRLWDQDGGEHRLPGYRVDAQTDAAIRFVDRPRDRPFFLFLSYLEPHHQNHLDNYPAPDGYEERYAGRWLPPDLQALGGSAPQHWGGYCGMVKRIDEALGRLFDALRSTGQLDRTVVLFTSDHGNHFKTRNAEYKRSCHDASIRVPTAICGPGFDGGGAVDQLVSLVDLAPTLLDAANLPVPATMVGRSVRSLLRARAEGGTAWPDEVFVQISESQTGRCVRTARWKYSVSCPDRNPASGEPVALSASAVYADECLYDLQADPWELNNLVGLTVYGSVVAEMRRRLVARMIAIGETEPRFIDAPPRPSGQRRVTGPGAGA